MRKQNGIGVLKCGKAQSYKKNEEGVGGGVVNPD